MAQSTIRSSDLTEDELAGVADPHSNTELRSSKEQSLLDRVKENLDLAKHLGFTSNERDTAIVEPVSEIDGQAVQGPQPSIATRLWQGANSVREAVVGASTVASGAVVPTQETSSEVANEYDERSDSPAADQSVDPQKHSSSSGDLPGQGRKCGSKWARDQVNYAKDGVPSKGLSDKVLPAKANDNRGKTWSQWAFENVVSVKDAASANVNKVKDTTTSNVKYVRDAAASRLPSTGGSASANAASTYTVSTGDKKPVTQSLIDKGVGLKDTIVSKFGYAPTSDTDASDYDVVSGDKKSVTQSLVHTGVELKDTIVSKLGYAADQSTKGPAVSKQAVQDVIDLHSTPTRTPEVGQKSVTKSLIDAGLGLKDGIATQLGYGPNPDSSAAARAATIKEQAATKAATLRRSTISAVSPGDGEKDLSKTITDSLSNLPSVLKEKMWISRSPKDSDIPVSTGPDPVSEEPHASGIVHRVSGVVSSATGVVSSYLPSGVASYLPGRGSSPSRGNEVPKSTSETAGPTEVTFEEKLETVGPEKLMELWTIGNGTLDWTVNSATLDPDSCLSPQSPRTPRTLAPSSSMWQQKNVKAEIVAQAHQVRVAIEANAYLESELRKVEAHAQKLLDEDLVHNEDENRAGKAKAEKHRLHEEGKAAEVYGKEELRAGLLIHNMELKTEKMLAKAKSKSLLIKAAAQEECEKAIADAMIRSEKSKAEIEEVKQVDMAEIKERVDRMIFLQELPAQSEHKGGVQKIKTELFHKVKENVICRLGAL